MAPVPQQDNLAPFYTPIEHAIAFGNWYRKRISEDLNIRRDTISSTELNTPKYQASLNCMEADLLQAIASTIQDHIDRMTHELELERNNKLTQKNTTTAILKSIGVYANKAGGIPISDFDLICESYGEDGELFLDALVDRGEVNTAEGFVFLTHIIEQQ